ncbi:MAG: c-type cytochrome [Pseudomonadales bacterium]|nr:c-type cytochrome [Pseudomonadales bacterium]
MKRIKAMTAMALCSMVTFSTLSSHAAEEPLMDPRFCQTCHGVDGIGNEGIQAPRIAGMEPWYLKRQLHSFKDGLRGTHPQDIEGMEMQPMAAILSDAEIDEVTRWVGSWPYVPAEPTLQGDADRGRTLFTPCASCHGNQAQGNEALNAPALQGQNDWYLLTQLKNFKAGYRGAEAGDRFGAQMRGMAQMLADEQAMIDVISYINTLGKK